MQMMMLAESAPTTAPASAEVMQGLMYAAAFATVVITAGLFPVLSALAVRGRRRGVAIVAALFCIAGLVAGQLLAKPWPRVQGLSLVYFLGGGLFVVAWAYVYRNDPRAGAPAPRPRKRRVRIVPKK